MQSPLLAIAGNTVRELVRSKLLYNLILFAALLIAGSLFVAQLTVGDWNRIILDQGLGAIEIVGCLLAVLIGVSIVAGEIERRTIFPTLAKPISRGGFLVGRFLGLYSILVVNVGLMLCLLGAVLKAAGSSLTWQVWAAALLICVELAVMAAVAILFSSFSTPILASAFSLAVFLIGHLLGDLRSFSDREKNAGAARALSLLFYRLLPDLEMLNIKSQVTNNLPITGRFVALSAGYGLAYAAAVLFLSTIVFGRRDLK